MRFVLAWLGAIVARMRGRRRQPFHTKDCLVGEHYSIGDHTYGCPRVSAWGEGANLRIGKYCSIARSVTIFLGGNHRTDWVSTYPFCTFWKTWPRAKGITGIPCSRGDVVIGNDVWIGQGAGILSGVTIGDGAVIGAHALVTSDVAPYAIVGGNPAREIRKRFDEATIKRLMTMRWWDWPDERVRACADLLCSARLEEFFRFAEKNWDGTADERR